LFVSFVGCGRVVGLVVAGQELYMLDRDLESLKVPISALWWQVPGQGDWVWRVAVVWHVKDGAAMTLLRLRDCYNKEEDNIFDHIFDINRVLYFTWLNKTILTILLWTLKGIFFSHQTDELSKTVFRSDNF